ncbi:hypothetical protein [Deinococcus sp.]|uniref:hypothetical protein n=1 Tax=Deinococcus sp. TaxID=47478 RepID=UPI003CC6215A
MSYFTSTRHLVGVGLALLGLLAHFLGWLGDWWLPIVAGLYLLGVLVTPRTRVDAQLAQEADVGELSAELRRLQGTLRGQKVPPAIQAQTRHIAEQLQVLLPRLSKLEAQGDPNAFTVRQLVTDYLPGTFKNYLNIPSELRSRSDARLGKTPDALVSEQLDLLSSTLDKVSADSIRGDTTAMLANGGFLKDKFGKPDLEL